VNYLEARRTLASFEGGPSLAFRLAMSGTPEPLEIFLRAEAARHDRTAALAFLPFNTLRQHLLGPTDELPELYLLCPWDLVPEADWRTGIPPGRLGADDLLAAASQVAALLRRRSNAKFVYLPASIPPLTGQPHSDQVLALGIESIAIGLGALRLSPQFFSLASYFTSGCPIGGGALGAVAESLIGHLLAQHTPAKLLVTDLDETIWSGLIAEEGMEGIGFGPEGAGYRHHVYQTLLVRLRHEGVLLAAVSRNDAEVVLPPFQSGRMPLKLEDFVAVIASYHPKSAQIRELVSRLNLGIDSVVYVDDNPVELAEVATALPGVTTIAFPSKDQGIPDLLARLTALFGRADVTTEDQERTELYRRRLEGLVPAEATGADLTRFLAGLGMELQIHDRSRGDRTRAVQLINKTNQFNANGRRWTDSEIASALEAGAQLLTATLTDRAGSHGEILACLIGVDGTIEALVMSCRVFQRRVEHGFFAALQAAGIRPSRIRFQPTERNSPFRTFLAEPGLSAGSNGLVPFDVEEFARRHQDALTLFEVGWS